MSDPRKPRGNGAVPAAHVGASLAMYLTLYLVLGAAYVLTVLRLARSARRVPEENAGPEVLPAPVRPRAFSAA